MQLRRKQLVRYGAPAAVVAVIAVGAAVPALSGAAAPPGLPVISAQQLLTEALSAKPAELSGSLRWTASLGLSDLSTLEQELGGSSGNDAFGSSSSGASSSAGSSVAGPSSAGPTAAGGPDSSSASNFNLLNLLAGSYQFNVWLDGAKAEHIAFLEGPAQEVDLVRNGDQAWLWDSTSDSVTHFVGQARPVSSAGAGAGAMGAGTASVPLTPGQMAARLLGKPDAYSTVSLGQPLYVAGQAAYQLLLSPKDAPTTTLNHIEVDVAAAGPLKGVVLQVSVYANGQAAPALELGFTGTVSPGLSPASELSFTPPPGAKVTTHQLGRHSGAGAAGFGAPDRAAPHTPTGAPARHDGWDSIMVGTTTSGANGAELVELSELSTVVTVDGQQARLFSTNLVNLLLMPDGQFFAGMVTPAGLEAYATTSSS